MTFSFDEDISKPSDIMRWSRRSFDRWAAIADSSVGWRLMAIWALAEALVWPIIPDVLLGLLVVIQPRRIARTLTAAIVGSAVGAALVWGLASTWPTEAERVLPHLPLAFEADVVSVRERIAQDGTFAFVRQPISGIPFKVWAIVGATSGLPPMPALAIVVLARAVRMSLVALVAAALGARFTSLIRDYWLVLLAIYLAVFVLGWIRTFPTGG
jgi:membrane protein YqaA with SNARE-associated domain